MVLVMLTDDRIMLLARRRRTGFTVELPPADDLELSAAEDASPPGSIFS
jgi:hypothetical protein